MDMSWITNNEHCSLAGCGAAVPAHRQQQQLVEETAQWLRARAPEKDAELVASLACFPQKMPISLRSLNELWEQVIFLDGGRRAAVEAACRRAPPQASQPLQRPNHEVIDDDNPDLLSMFIAWTSIMPITMAFVQTKIMGHQDISSAAWFCIALAQIFGVISRAKQ